MQKFFEVFLVAVLPHEARIALHIRREDGRQLAFCCRDLLVLEIRHGFLARSCYPVFLRFINVAKVCGSGS